MADPEAGLSLWACRGPDPCTRPSGAVPRLPRVPLPGLPGSLRPKEGGSPSPHPRDAAHPGTSPVLRASSWELLALSAHRPSPCRRDRDCPGRGLRVHQDPSLGRPGADGLQGPRNTGRGDSAVNQQERQVQRSPKPSLGAPRLTGLRRRGPGPRLPLGQGLCTHVHTRGVRGQWTPRVQVLQCDTHTHKARAHSHGHTHPTHVCTHTHTHAHAPEQSCDSPFHAPGKYSVRKRARPSAARPPASRRTSSSLASGTVAIGGQHSGWLEPGFTNTTSDLVGQCVWPSLPKASLQAGSQEGQPRVGRGGLAAGPGRGAVGGGPDCGSINRTAGARDESEPWRVGMRSRSRSPCPSCQGLPRAG